MKKPIVVETLLPQVVWGTINVHSNLTNDDLRGYSTTTTTVHWRHLLAWLLWHKTNMRLEDIAREMHRTRQGTINAIRHVADSIAMQEWTNRFCRHWGWQPIECGLTPPSLEDVVTACDELVAIAAALRPAPSVQSHITEETPGMATRTRTRTMSDEHKEALAVGRDHGRTVRRYLEALDSTKLQRGRPIDVDTARARLEEVKAQLADSLPALDRLQLAQRQIDLEAAIAKAESASLDQLPDLEAAFVRVAAAYSERKGVSYAAWRSAGVSPRVLAAAGISRG